MLKVREVGRFGFFEVEEAEIWIPGATGLPYKCGTILVFDSFKDVRIGYEIAWASSDKDAQETVARLIDGTQKVSLAFTIESARKAESENERLSSSGNADDSLSRPNPEETPPIVSRTQQGRPLTKWQ